MKKTAKSEVQLACELIRLLDGLPIEKAKEALICAQSMLLSTQAVNAVSPLLAVADENEAIFDRQG